MIEIIPAMDLIDGRCVRLTQGDFSRSTVYSAEPVNVAKEFEQAGIKRLHMVDLDGARTGRPANLRVLETVASATSLVIDFGGGLKTDGNLDAVFAAGAAIATIGSVAVKQLELFQTWIARYGGENLLLGADAKDGQVVINGWQTDTNLPILDYLEEYAGRGVSKIFVTDVASDGAMNGPAIELYRTILAAVPTIELVASGGVRSLADIDELERIGCSGVIVGKAIYEGNIALKDLQRYAG